MCQGCLLHLVMWALCFQCKGGCAWLTLLSPSLRPQRKARVGSDASLSRLIGSGEIGQSENELFRTKVQWSMCLNAHSVLQTWLGFTVLFGEVLF